MTPRKKSMIEEKMEVINDTVSMKLEEMEGIGTVRLKKLYANNIYTVDDLTSYGEESLVRMLDISYEDASKMIRTAQESINTENVISSMMFGGAEFKKYRKDRIKYMTTGLEEFDEITGRYETGVITEFFGAYGSGKTQFMMVASIMAQMPENPCCLNCGKTPEPVKDKSDCKIEVKFKNQEYCECGGLNWSGGGLSEWGKPCRTIYIDTEDSYRPERLRQIAINRGYVLTKKQTITQIKQQADKIPLNEEEELKADSFVNNITVVTPRTSGLQHFAISNLNSMISGDFCKICHMREINENNEPTHQNHPKAKDDMKLMDHDFERDEVAKMVIVDSLTGRFRKEYEGRGTLSDRQTKLTSHVKLLEGAVRSKNVICLVTNQAQDDIGVLGDNTRPIGGHVIGHTFTHRIYLKKPQSITKNKITAILVDSPNMAKNEIVLELGGKGIQEITP